MLHAKWSGFWLGRVNPAAPLAVILAGLVAFGIGRGYVGGGLIVGALLAFVNGLLLSRRVETAADIGDSGMALMVMQLGLLVTFTIVGVTTIILIKISPTMAIASVIGFAISHLGILALFYFTRGRAITTGEGA